MMLVPDLMPILTTSGLRVASQVGVGEEIWTGAEWLPITTIGDNASARFYDYDFSTATFRANAAARIWQPGGNKCPAQLYSLKTALGPDGDYAPDAIAEWDGYCWAAGDWIDSLNKPCIKTLDEIRIEQLMPSTLSKLRDLYVHKESRIQRKSFERRALIPSVYMHAELPQLRAFLRGYVVAKVTDDGTMDLANERHACTMQLALNAIGIETERKGTILRFPDTIHVNRVMGLSMDARSESITGQLRAVLAKGELKCFSWDVPSCWMAGVILLN